MKVNTALELGDVKSACAHERMVGEGTAWMSERAIRNNQIHWSLFFFIVVCFIFFFFQFSFIYFVFALFFVLFFCYSVLLTSFYRYKNELNGLFIKEIRA